MPRPKLINRYMDQLLQGRRCECRTMVWEALEKGAKPQKLYHELLWPAMEQVGRLYREDRINVLVEHMATRINRVLADQIQRELPRRVPNGKRIVVTCSEGENEELGAQMCSDLFESNGWDVYYLGGGVPDDEILELIGRVRPNILLVFGVIPQDVPGVRSLMELIREIGVNPTMNIMVSGGVFNRAEDLWKEINADLFASSGKAALKIAEEASPRVPKAKVEGTPKKRRRRRRPPLLEEYDRQNR